MATTIKAAAAPSAYPRTVTFGAPKRARVRMPKISTKRAASKRVGKRMGRGA